MKGWDTVEKHRTISVIYKILLALGIFFCIYGAFRIPLDLYLSYSNKEAEIIEPDEVTYDGENVRIFRFSSIDWSTGGSCLNFMDSHQGVKVSVDGELLFQRSASKTIWGHTTGFAWEYLEIPTNAQEVTVTITACYPEVRDTPMVFYRGLATVILRDMFHEEGFTMIVSFLNVCLGVTFFIYGAIMRNRSTLGTSMIYLGVFTILVGIWSITENGITALLVMNRPINSFISYTALALVGIPFVMFVHCYLQPDDKYVHKIILGLNIITIITTFSLQALGIKDMKQTLTLIHIAMVAAFLYLPFGLVHMLVRKLITRRFWVTLCSLLSVFPPLAYTLFMYYSGKHNVDSYGNVFIFVFIGIFAVDVARAIIKDVDAAKKAEIYHELAIKDMLTGCYNRNAYRNDTENLTKLDDILLVICDLNNLKKCNDTLGHAYGDQYIVDSAKILKKIFEDYGNVYRIGGDEFCIVIHDSHRCSMEILLAELTEEQHLYNEESEILKLQIACGYSKFNPGTDTSMEDIRSRADELMYINKKELKKIS
jgi:diguanylate cyclase (GGDEF)-like protein